MAGFKYKPRSREQVEKRKNQSANDFVGIFLDGVKTFQVKEGGENCLRILPPTWEDAEHYGQDVFVHYGVGPDRASVLCIAKHGNKACPVCELRAKLQAQGDEDEAKELRASKGVVMYVINRDAEKEGVLAWRAPFSLDADIAKVSMDSRSGETFNIDDPEDGFDVMFDVEGKGMQRKYKGVKLARKPSSVATKHLKYIEENPLPDVLNILSYKEIAKLLGGGPSKKSKRDEDEDEDEDEKPRRRTRARDDEDEDEDEKPKSKRRRPVDDDEDEEDEKPKSKRRSRDDDDDDDEDEKPKAKRRRPADDDDEDEEDEKPKSKRRRPADDDEDEDEDEKPRRVKRKVVDEDEDDEDEKPKKKKRARDDDDEDDDVPFDGGKRVKRKASDDDDDEDEEDEKPRASIRERLKARKGK